MKTCANRECVKLFRPKKSWGKYCSTRCGNLIRMRRHRAKK
jgi:hypothetical protein